MKTKFENYCKKIGLAKIEAYLILFSLITAFFCFILQLFPDLPLGLSFAFWGFGLSYLMGGALGYFYRDYDVVIPIAISSLITALICWSLF